MAFFDPSRPQDFVFISGTKVCLLCDFRTYGLVLIDHEAPTDTNARNDTDADTSTQVAYMLYLN